MYMYHVSDITHNSTKCRICSSVVKRSHCVSLFSPEMTKCNLAFRMSRLLEVPKISQEDPLPHYACCSFPWNLSWKICALLQSQAISHWPLPAQSSSLQLIRNVQKILVAMTYPLARQKLDQHQSGELADLRHSSHLKAVREFLIKILILLIQ